MSDPKELFPFPVVGDDDAGANPSTNPSGSEALPGFPAAATAAEPASADALTAEEVKDLRRLLQEYRSGMLKPGSKKEEPAPLPLPVMPTISVPEKVPAAKQAAELPLREQVLELLRQFDVTLPSEATVRQELPALLTEIAEPTALLTVWSAVCGVFPLRGCLRHGTPDQRLFALIALGDRFCEHLTGIRWPGRQSLIKLMGRFLSEVSEGCSFLSMEQEPFQPTYHERVPGAASGNSLIRETRGYLVVRRQNNQVLRLGRVWT